MIRTLIISENDGSISISDCNVIIGPKTTRETLAASLRENLLNINDYGNGYKWLTFGEFQLINSPCNISVCFNGDVVQQIRLSIIDKSVSASRDWPTCKDIDREIEIMKTVFGKIFHRKFNDGYEQFSWGSVWCNFDSKAFLASSGIRYDCK